MYKKPTDKDWIEDWKHDNGMYMGTCGQCKGEFIGHKRRHLCKECYGLNQRIVAAANRFHFSFAKPLVVISARHWDENMHHIVSNLSEDLMETVVREEQGFVNQYGQFLTREDAWIVAERQGQIRRDLGSAPGRLYSEHLY